MIGLACQCVVDQLHGTVEGNGVAIHAGEEVLAHLEVEALLGQRGQARREDEQEKGDCTHGYPPIATPR
ncbi:MAG: hypothetical protein HYX38_30945 [Rhodospirillales bacterium]|nr:hypothetical protein [Rhodospirillales bacterium]